MNAAPLQAWYLPPALEAGLETTVQRFGPPHDAVELALPVVQSADLTRWIDALLGARGRHLARRPTSAVVRVLTRVARRFLRPADPARLAAVDSLSRAGRFRPAEIIRALDDAFAPLADGGLARWLVAELGSAAALDRVTTRREGPARRAHGPEWMLHYYAGNVPALPVWPMFAALLLRAALIAKTASREPLLAPLLARTIAEEDSGLGECLAVVWWKGGSSDLDREAIGRAPAVLAFGGHDAIAEIARASRPRARVALHGPKVSAACVAREALTPAGARETARRTAVDVALYDQQGCLSPHAVYVERGGRVRPEEFAALLGEALAEACGSVPPARAPEEEARARLYRTQAEFVAAAGGGAERVIAPERSAGFAVLLESGARFEPGPAHRVVRVHAVESLKEALAALRPHARYLEAVALEARGARRAGLIAAIAELGVPRVAAPGRLQQPSPLGAHGGVGFLAPFVTWTTVDPPRAAGDGRARGGSPAARPERSRRARASTVSRSSGRGSRRGARAARRSR
jgi:Acyl-CoA reductase (LuxC)